MLSVSLLPVSDDIFWKPTSLEPGICSSITCQIYEPCIMTTLTWLFSLSSWLLNTIGENQFSHIVCTKKNGRPYLKVHRFHIMPHCVGPAQWLQHWGHLVWVVKVLHQFVDGIHDSVSMIPKLDTPLQLLRLLDVFEVTEVLLGWWEVHKQPGKEDSWTLWVRRTAAVKLGWSHSSQPAPARSWEVFSFFFKTISKY